MELFTQHFEATTHLSNKNPETIEHHILVILQKMHRQI